MRAGLIGCRLAAASDYVQNVVVKNYVGSENLTARGPKGLLVGVVGNESAGFLNEYGTGCDVPGFDERFDVGIEASGRHVTKFGFGGTEGTYTGHTSVEVVDETLLEFGVCLYVVWESK